MKNEQQIADAVMCWLGIVSVLFGVSIICLTISIIDAILQLFKL